MIRPSLLLVLLASPALSQTMDAEHRAVEAYVACVSIKGDLALAGPTFAIYGWTDTEETDDGTVFTRPGSADTTKAFLSSDGSACRVESLEVGTEAALAVLTGALRFTEFTEFAVETDANACSVVRLDATATATLLGGNELADCTAANSSVITFAFGPQN